MTACTDAVAALNGKFFPKLCRRGGALEVALKDAEFTACISARKFNALKDQLRAAQQLHALSWLELVLPQDVLEGMASIKLCVDPEEYGAPSWADIKVGGISS